MARKVFRGWIAAKITEAATTGHTLGTQVNIPGSAFPVNPLNRDRPGVVNVSGENSVEFEGKLTPTLRIVAPLKSSWWTPNFVTSLLIGLTAGGDTAEWGIGMNDTDGNRVYDGCRCERLILTGNPACRAAIMDFKAITPEVGATTFSTPTTDAGKLIKAAQMGWTSATADIVREWGLVLERDQMWDMVANESDVALAIRSGYLRGALSLGQDPDWTNSPESSGNVSGTAVLNLGASGGGVKFTLQVSNDEDNTPHIPGVVTTTRNYSLIDLADGAGSVAVAVV